MRTVQDFIDHILPDSTAEMDLSDELRRKFFNARPGRRQFWNKLLDIGVQKATCRSCDCENIYETALLTEEEWDALQAEFDAL